MTSLTRGANTSPAEVTNVDRFGIWLLVDEKEYFLPYEKFPWFRQATIAEILDVESKPGGHLRWPALDVDLSLEILEDPDSFPLVYR